LVLPVPEELPTQMLPEASMARPMGEAKLAAVYPVEGVMAAPLVEVSESELAA
jgi:hypothetical protein